MSLDTTDDTVEAFDDAPVEDSSATLRRVLFGVIAVAVLAIAVAAGFFAGTKNPDTTAAPPTPGIASVDAGFARDMSTHHEQAITMATYTYHNSTDPVIGNLAYDIATSQTTQVGEMLGWMDSWGLSGSTATPPAEMSWMGGMHMSMSSDGLMPGMATPAQMTTLQTLHGKALDIMFLQLMIRHHQGGLSMEQYAAAHATEPYVRALAQNMVTLQGREIVEMEQLLGARGGTPLPAPVG